MLVTDRSRILAFQRCPRQRYLAYHYDGTGIQRKGLSVPLVTGSMVHKGLELLLTGHTLSEALTIVLNDYDSTVQSRGFNLDNLNKGGDMMRQISHTYQEQRALVEGLIRVFDVYGKPLLLREYDVISVEGEINVPLAQGLTFMSRPDGVLRNKETGQIFSLSFKTASQFSRETHLAGQVDMQGKSESWAVQQQFPDEFIGGVQMFYLLKGRRKEEANGLYVQASGLVRPWFSEKNQSYAHTYYFKNPQTGSNSNIGTTYKPFNVWERSFGSFGQGVAGWVEMMRHGRVQPALGNPFKAFIEMPQPYYRNQAEIDEWMESVQAQEADVIDRLSVVEKNPNALIPLFPKHTDRCNDYGGCTFYGVCHQGEQFDNFVRREPHHTLETEIQCQN